MQDDIREQKGYSICDYCGRMTRVVIQYLNGEAVNVFCKACRTEDIGDDDE